MPLFSNQTTSWAAFTPTGTWSTNTTYAGFERRVGDTLEFQILITLAGAPNSVQLTLGVPGSRTVNESKLISSTSQSIIGYGWLGDAGTGQGLVIMRYDKATDVIIVQAHSSSSASVVTVTQAAPITFAINDNLSLVGYLPISGW